MAIDASLDQRARHQVREQAIWRIKMAGYAAFASASLAVVMFGMIGLDTGEWRSVIPYLIGAALTFLLGARVFYRRSQLAAALLMILAAATMVLQIVRTGALGGLLVGAAFVYCYVQGFRGTVDLEVLAKSEGTQESMEQSR